MDPTMHFLSHLSSPLKVSLADRLQVADHSSWWRRTLENFRHVFPELKFARVKSVKSYRVWLQSQASRFPARASSFCWPSKACVWLDASNLVRGEFRSFDEFSIFSNYEESYISWNHNRRNLALLSKALRPLGNSAPTCRGCLVQLTYVNSDSTACLPQDTTNNMLQQASSFSILSVATVFVMAAYIVAEQYNATL